MKRNILIAAMICFSCMQGFAQGLSDKSMTFFGIDFSKAKMIGSDGFKDPADLKDKITAWNALFKVEAAKYDLYKPFRKETIVFDFANVDKNNGALNTSGMIVDNDYKITPEQAAEVVKAYDTQGKTGLGCAFVVESFNKTKVAGYIYVVLFDMASKKILVNVRMEEKPGGFGLKNYWAKAILGAIEESGSDYPKWVKGKF